MQVVREGQEADNTLICAPPLLPWLSLVGCTQLRSEGLRFYLYARHVCRRSPAPSHTLGPTQRFVYVLLSSLLLLMLLLLLLLLVLLLLLLLLSSQHISKQERQRGRLVRVASTCFLCVVVGASGFFHAPYFLLPDEPTQATMAGLTNKRDVTYHRRRLSRRSEADGVIICGDFNMTPDSACYHYMIKGELHVDGMNR